MSVSELDPARKELIDAVSHELCEIDGPTDQAMKRYSGVLYRELDALSLRGTARRRLDRDVLIVSGMWGLVGARDPIPWYKLKMSARIDGLGRLSTWWRPAVTDALAPRVKGSEVWDLLPVEHSGAVDWSVLAPRRRTTIRFIDRSGAVVAHWNKLLKGSVVRWLAETGARRPEDLAAFEHPRGYVFDVQASIIDANRAQVVMREK